MISQLPIELRAEQESGFGRAKANIHQLITALNIPLRPPASSSFCSGANRSVVPSESRTPGAEPRLNRHGSCFNFHAVSCIGFVVLWTKDDGYANHSRVVVYGLQHNYADTSKLVIGPH